MSVLNTLTLIALGVLAVLAIMAGGILIAQQLRGRREETPPADAPAPDAAAAVARLHRLGPPPPSTPPPAPPPFESGAAPGGSLGPPGITLPKSSTLPNIFEDDEQPTELMTADHLRKVLEQLDQNPTPGRLVAEDK